MFYICSVSVFQGICPFYLCCWIYRRSLHQPSTSLGQIWRQDWTDMETVSGETPVRENMEGTERAWELLFPGFFRIELQCIKWLSWNTQASRAPFPWEILRWWGVMRIKKEVKKSKAQDMWISETNSKVGPLAWKWQ